MSGKGSSPRPYSVPLETFDNNYNATFRTQQLEVTEQEEEAWQELEDRSNKTEGKK
jgi:hypothetical protein